MDGAGRLRLLKALQAHLESARRFRAWRDTDRLLALLGGIADPELRLHRFGEYLKGQPGEGTAWTIAALWERVASGDRRAQTVFLGLLEYNRLVRVLDAESLGAVQTILERGGDSSAALLASARGQAAALLNREDAETLPRPKEPVGFRISLARRPAPRLIDRLLFDPDARVVRTILQNPRLTEAEVIKLAASRRASPGALEVIAQSDRWIARYPVELALANNPVTPLRVVLG
jgi:hypothetical protein